jgi:hypothetical protein
LGLEMKVAEEGKRVIEAKEMHKETRYENGGE